MKVKMWETASKIRHDAFCKIFITITIFLFSVIGCGGEQDTTPPELPEVSRITVHQNPPGKSDTISGAPGAVEANAYVIVYADPSLSTEIGRVKAGSDGSFGEIDIGDNQYDTVYIVVQDSAGNRSGSISLTNDVTPPDTSLSLHPDELTNLNSATFVFMCSEKDCSYECQLDNGEWSPCTLPKTYDNLSEGSHTFRVRAVDPAGNADTSPASFTWTVDTTPPDTNIASSPSDASNSTSATFEFTSTESGSTFECQINDWGWTSCASPKEYAGLSEGTYTFKVRAIDEAGNKDNSPAAFTWTVDLTPPDTSITSSPPVLSNSTSAQFSFTSTEDNSSFGCKLDAEGWQSCQSSIAYTNLSEGFHTFYVKAIDPAGNEDATPATYSWEIDLTPPETSLTSYPSNPTNSTSADFSFASTEENSSFGCKLDGEAWQSCPSPMTYTGLSEGLHTFYVKAIDPAGNEDPTPATYTWQIDLTPPETYLSFSYPSGLTYSTSATFQFTSSEANSSFECKLNSEAWVPCTSPKNYAGLSEGSYTFYVRARDLAGNEDPSPATHYWRIDPLPEVYITSSPSNPTNLTSATFEFSSSETTSTFECDLDGGGWSECTSPVTYTSLSEDSHTFKVRAVDPVWSPYNIYPEPASFTWEIDNTPPDTTITAYPSDPTFSTSATFEFTSSEAGSSFECQLDGGGWSSCTSPITYFDLSEGTHTFEVRAIDMAGNVDTSPDAYTWTIKYWAQVSAGASHACAIAQDGTLWCWGGNAYGQLGIGTTDNVNIPTQVGEDSDWKTVSAGSYHTCALKTDGSLYCWGANGYGQLGDGTTYPYKATPTLIGTGWIAISAGGYHTCGIKTDTTLYCWGSDGHGQLGDGDYTNKNTPTLVAWTGWVSISAGGYHTCGIKENGANKEIYCWGYNYYGQLGDGTNADKNQPTQVSTSITDWASVSTGDNHTCAITSGTALYCWGYNYYGQLGDGTNVDKNTPKQIGVNYDSVEGGANHTCAVEIGGVLYCWGYNYWGQLGIGSTQDQNSPQFIEIGWSSVSAGGNHTCGVKDDNTLYCWGRNLVGQLGQGEFANKYIPTQIGTGTSWSFPDGGYYHTCGILSNTAYCWGYNKYGQLGIGNNYNKNAPEQVDTSSWSTLSAGMYHTCGIKTGRTLWCWGFNSQGQLGVNDTTNRNTPTQEYYGWTDWASVSAGIYHTCGTRTNGTLWCWGHNGYRQLGDGTTDYRKLIPTQEATLATNWESVSAGGFHTCAVKTDGTLYCWGRNNQGQLGTGTPTDQNLNVPTQVGNDTDWDSVSTGIYHTCAIKTNGTLWCWGHNGYGQLGDGTYAGKNIPVQIGVESDWASVSAGGYHTCGIKIDGTLWCWGRNNIGQLGDGTTDGRNTPTQVGTDSDWQSVFTSLNNTCAVKTDGRLFCWGYNSHGQVGDGTAWKEQPVQVLKP